MGKKLVVTAVAASTLGLMAALPAASSAAPGGLQTFKPGHALYQVGVHTRVTSAEAAKAAFATSTFPQFTSNVTVGATSYQYTLAGMNPAVPVTNATSTIQVDLIPLVLKFGSSLKWDPTAADSCDPGVSALTRFKKSPLFASQAQTWDGVALGSHQLTDEQMRAEFYHYVATVNPTYNTNFKFVVMSKKTINVPVLYRAAAPISCGNGYLGATDINWLDPYLQTHVIPSISGIGPNVVPFFLVHNFVEYITTTLNCCVIGYHNAYNVTTGVQTYGLADYDNSGAFSGFGDIAAPTHELGEWANDPYTTNPTPSWGMIGQVTGCQNNLEVGDPLSGTTFADTFNGFTYHPQELAFFSWFYDQSPTVGLPGWYSDQGTFTTFAAPCP